MTMSFEDLFGSDAFTAPSREEFGSEAPPASVLEFDVGEFPLQTGLPDPETELFASSTVTDHTAADIGKVYLLTEAEQRAFFPEGVPGKLEDDWQVMKSRAVLIREADQRIIDALRRQVCPSVPFVYPPSARLTRTTASVPLDSPGRCNSKYIAG
jgi:hypothetical protein